LLQNSKHQHYITSPTIEMPTVRILIPHQTVDQCSLHVSDYHVFSIQQ